MPKIAVAGLIHGHVWSILDDFSKVEGVTFTAVADRTPLLEKARDRFQRHYTDWREMLAQESMDALIVTSDNLESAEIAVEALGRGIPCFVEKAMAASAADADRMRAAANASGKTLMINWPFAWNPWLDDLKRRLDANELGHVFHMRFRNGHFGPKEIGCDEWFVGWLHDEARNGGGAIADFGGYGAVLARYYFGMPEAVYAIRHNATKSYEVSDDHAIILLKYPKLSVSLEATWATKGMDGGPNPVIHGSDGTFAVTGNTIEHGTGWGDRTALEPAALAIPRPAAYFLHCIETGAVPHGVLNPDISADACRIIDAAKQSASTGAEVRP
ncbi:MAG: Gfo/Idh/MocA family oxidoreductase [Fimbriimonadaceae bacterium]|nr:Gfo/Idh/MocA family oxidoreductase [Fimbriimonadaceae bacterium]